MAEVNLLDTYPNPSRDVEWRARNITPEQIQLARQFGKEFFDGDRLYGYGGYVYDGRWLKVVERFRDYYGLKPGHWVLDVGCAKGFMLYDFLEVIDGIEVAGIDISEYAIANALERVRPFVRVGNARDLPYPDQSFDLIIAINTVHNLPLPECKKAIGEIQRVSRKHAFIVVDSYHNDFEKDRMLKWNLTGQTIMSAAEWKKLFEEVGYTGDYYWFIP